MISDLEPGNTNPSTQENTKAYQITDSGSQPTYEVQSFSSQQQKLEVTRSKIITKVTLIVLVLLIILSLIYFVLLPTLWSKSYTQQIKAPYTEQVDKINSAFKSFGRAVFVSDNTSTESDKLDLGAAKNAVNAALTATDNLKHQNTFTYLPGMTLFGVGSKARAQYASMESYVNDSNEYLTNYSDTIDYIQQLELISSNDSANFIKAFSDVLTAKTKSQLLNNAKQGLPAVQKYLADLKSLKPSQDLKQLQSDTLNIVGEVQNAFTNVITGLSTNNDSATANGAKQLNEAARRIDVFVSQKTTDILQKNSSLSKQIQKLKSEQPLN